MCIFFTVALANVGLWKGHPNYTWSIGISNSVIYFFYYTFSTICHTIGNINICS